MDNLLFGILVSEKQKMINESKFTALFRKDGRWHDGEIGKMVNDLLTEAYIHPEFPEFVILWGHHTKEQTLEALGGGIAYTATLVTGIKDLPFKPPCF